VHLAQLLHPGGHVERPDGGEREAAALAPRKERAAGAGIGPTRVRVLDVGGEEFDVAPAGRVAGVGDERRHYVGVGRAGELTRLNDGGELVGHDDPLGPSVSFRKNRL
jgi:hypothetical protein